MIREFNRVGVAGIRIEALVAYVMDHRQGFLGDTEDLVELRLSREYLENDLSETRIFALRGQNLCTHGQLFVSYLYKGKIDVMCVEEALREDDLYLVWKEIV